MKHATLTAGQAKKIIELFEDAPVDQVQAVLASGLLADLRDANIAEIDREKFRNVCGLKPINSPFLVGIPTVAPGT